MDLHASVAFLLEAWLGDEGAGRSVGAFSRPVEKFPLNFRHYYLKEIVNVNFESKCSIYVQHNLLTLFNCSPRLLLLLFRTFWNCSVLLLFTYMYRIAEKLGS